MKLLIPGILIFYTVLIACNSSGLEDSGSLATGITSIINRPFSDSLQADTFKVSVLGTAPKNMHLAFTIISFKGKKIYDIDIKVTDLFKNYDATIDLSKKKNQIKFLNDEVDRFFNDENFMEPAVTEQEIPDKNVPDKLFFKELKSTQLNGFIYRLGKENKNYIAWSVKDQKVKTYYSCCKQ